jgi:hypothetical protein
MASTTEVTLLGGERHRVAGGLKEVERMIVDAARGSILQLAWLTDAETAEPLVINPEYVMMLRALEPTGQSRRDPGDPSLEESPRDL